MAVANTRKKNKKILNKLAEALKTSGKIIYWVFVVVIVAVALLVVFPSIPAIGKDYRNLVVLSGSMEPTLKVGSLVTVKKSADYAVGDIITFGDGKANSKVLITHRIVAADVKNGQQYFTTKGDANNGKDREQVPQNRVIGKELFTIPYLGHVVNFTRKPFGFALLIMIPAGMVIMGEGKIIVSEIKKREETKNG
ncbi:MAG: signal peptidase I [Candidatus Pacebacteria bacterium]|nr:signal peptidase I [Candidatus Paceibacterota bacterium]